MKQLLIMIFLASSLFANYAYKGENSGKIDMHGGKSDKLINGSSKFSTPSIKPLGSIGLAKPKEPVKPQGLIKEEVKKEIKNNSSKNKKTTKTSSHK